MPASTNQPARAVARAAVAFAIGAGLVALRYTTGYLVFHSLVEIFAVSVAVAVFLVVWSTRDRISGYLLWIGVAYLFVGVVDLVHTLAYKGMGTLPVGEGADAATQLWLVARGMQAITLASAPLFAVRRGRPRIAVAFFTTLTALGLASVLWWDVFPVAFVEGQGLTPFKIGSEWVIVAFMLAGLFGLHRVRASFAPATVRSLEWSIGLTVLSELSFMLYTDVYGIANLAGHLLKLAAFYVLYRALVEETLTRPLDVLFREVAEAERTARRLYEQQREIADVLQAGMLAMPESLPGIEMAHDYRSSSDIARIGGDFYDAFTAPEGLVCFALGDVSGKGVAAAQLTQITRSTLRAYAAEDPAPASVLGRANRALVEQIPEGQFVTAVFAVLDPRTGLLRMGCAGHPTPVVCGPEACNMQKLETDPPLGLFEDLEFAQAEFQLRPGDTTVVFSDGLLDTASDSERFGEARVRDILHRQRSGSPVEAVSTLMDAVDEFGGGKVTDDVAVLALRWPGPADA